MMIVFGLFSKKSKDIARLSIQDLYADLAQRPSAQAIA